MYLATGRSPTKFSNVISYTTACLHILLTVLTETAMLQVLPNNLEAVKVRETAKLKLLDLQLYFMLQLSNV